MAGYPGALDPTTFYHSRLFPRKMDPSFKIDEGYSEDTRSQDDPDSPTRADSAMEDSIPLPWSLTAGIPAQILAMSEAERSGENAYM